MTKSQLTDDYIRQATCAVQINGQERGSAWLLSKKGHLLTAAHVLPDTREGDTIKVRFRDNCYLEAKVIKRVYEENAKGIAIIDFAVLQLINPVVNRFPLRISLIQSINGNFRLCGYGKTLVSQSIGRANYVTTYDIDESDKKRLFQFTSKQLCETGYSGGGFVSDELQAVVAIQTTMIGNKDKETVFGMPLYRIAKYWKDIKSIEKNQEPIERIDDNQLTKLKENLISHFESLSNDAIDIYQAIQKYFTQAPMENATSEHFLMLMRRYIASFIKLKQVDKDKVKLFILEPIIIETIRCDSGKELNEIKYEIARFLSEIGKYNESISIFEEVIENLKDKESSRIMKYYALNGLAVALQNIGLFNKTHEILLSLKDELETIDRSDAVYNDIKYFVYKHYATVLRRVYFYDLENVVNKIEDSFNKAEQFYLQSYHVNFSRGYFYYLIGKDYESKSEYEKCKIKLKKLNDEQDEYYLIHIKYALTLMRLCRIYEKNSFNKDIEPHLQQCKISIEKYGNDRAELSEILLEVIDICKTGVGIDTIPQKIKAKLSTPESLYCIKHDVFCILDFFNETDVKSDIEKLFEEITTRFEKIKLITSLGKVTPREIQGICIYLDIKNLDKISYNRHVIYLKKLGEKINIYFSNFFDDVSFRGNRYILIKNIQQNDESTKYLKEFLSKLDLFIRDINEETQNDLYLGIGISCGSVIYLHSGKTSSFYGDAIDYALKMSDMAIPSGIVIHLNDYVKAEELRALPFLFEKFEYSNKTETFSVLATYNVSSFLGYNYIFLPKDKTERRFFINYGKKCSRGCLYCINQEEINQFKEYNHELFEEEFRKFFSEDKYKGFLVSLGHTNEVLDNSNIDQTIKIVKFIISNTDNPIQIATKESSNTIKQFLYRLSNELTEDIIKDRVFIMYSICSIDFSEKLENRKINQGKMVELNEQYNIIPYVKPFLPGITDKDEQLKSFLKNFQTIVIGYPYFSAKKLKNLSWFCINNNLIEANRYYNFWEQFKKKPLNLSHPSHFNSELYSFDYSYELEGFVSDVNTENIFRSSPCAIAHLNKLTCYTNIGNSNNSIHNTLCRGNSSCKNRYCLYHKTNREKNVVERIMIELTLDYSNISDKTHSIDHFFRVHNIANNLAKKEELNDKDKEILDLCCLLHDVGDRKLSKTLLKVKEEDKRAEIARLYMEEESVNESVIEKVTKIIGVASYDDFIKQEDTNERRRNFTDEEKRIANILEDADKIDAIGAIGIARCFAFKKNKGLFNIDENPRSRKKQRERIGYASAITHFYEKLIHLYDLLNLETSKKYSIERHKYLIDFVKTFLDEYDITYADSGVSGEYKKNKINALKVKVENKSWFKE